MFCFEARLDRLRAHKHSAIAAFFLFALNGSVHAGGSSTGFGRDIKSALTAAAEAAKNDSRAKCLPPHWNDDIEYLCAWRTELDGYICKVRESRGACAENQDLGPTILLLEKYHEGEKK